MQAEHFRLPQPALQVSLEYRSALVLAQAVTDENEVPRQLFSRAVCAGREAVKGFRHAGALEPPLHDLQKSAVDLVRRNGLQEGNHLGSIVHARIQRPAQLPGDADLPL